MENSSRVYSRRNRSIRRTSKFKVNLPCQRSTIYLRLFVFFILHGGDECRCLEFHAMHRASNDYYNARRTQSTHATVVNIIRRIVPLHKSAIDGRSYLSITHERTWSTRTRDDRTNQTIYTEDIHHAEVKSTFSIEIRDDPVSDVIRVTLAVRIAKLSHDAVTQPHLS